MSKSGERIPSSGLDVTLDKVQGQTGGVIANWKRDEIC
jgi:hypothetical protein